MSERFTFQIAGKDYSLPKQVTAGAMRKAVMSGGGDPLTQAFTILQEVADAETLAAIDTLPMSEFNDIVARQWLRGMAVGESSSSSPN